MLKAERGWSRPFPFTREIFRAPLQESILLLNKQALKNKSVINPTRLQDHYRKNNATKKRDHNAKNILEIETLPAEGGYVHVKKKKKVEKVFIINPSQKIKLKFYKIVKFLRTDISDLDCLLRYVYAESFRAPPTYTFFSYLFPFLTSYLFTSYI